VTFNGVGLLRGGLGETKKYKEHSEGKSETRKSWRCSKQKLDILKKKTSPLKRSQEKRSKEKNCNGLNRNSNKTRDQDEYSKTWYMVKKKVKNGASRPEHQAVIQVDCGWLRENY